MSPSPSPLHNSQRRLWVPTGGGGMEESTLCLHLLEVPVHRSGWGPAHASQYPGFQASSWQHHDPFSRRPNGGPLGYSYLDAQHILKERAVPWGSPFCCGLGQQLVEGEVDFPCVCASFSTCTRSWQVRYIALQCSSF